MRKIVWILCLTIAALTACSHGRVSVDLDSCQERGKIDGIRVGECEPVKIVK